MKIHFFFDVSLFYFLNLNGSSAPSPPQPHPITPHLFCALSRSPCPFCLPSIFFPSQKKNTSKFQNETNENKNRVVLFFILQKIYSYYYFIHTHDISSKYTSTKHVCCWSGDQKIDQIEIERKNKTNSDWIAVGIFLYFYFHFSHRSSPILQWPWFCMDTQSKQ